MIILQQLHEAYDELLYQEDYNFIDTLLATYITTRVSGEPIWLVPTAPSGYGKTEYQRPYMKLSEDDKYNILMLDSATARSFASGMSKKDRDSVDYGAKMAGQCTFILIPDMASILSTNAEERGALFAMFRTLYDGYIIRSTGSECKTYKDIYTHLFACSTPEVKYDVEFLNKAGTRELLYDAIKIEHPEKRLSKQINDNGRSELYSITKDYIDQLLPKLDTIGDYQCKNDLPIDHIANYISAWRVEPKVDDFGYLVQKVQPEYIDRVFKQLKKLYMGLKFIGVEEPLQTLKSIRDGCGNTLRREVYNYLDKEDPLELLRKPKSLISISNDINRSKDAVRTQLMILRDLDWVYVSPNSEGKVFSDNSMWTIEDKI